MGCSAGIRDASSWSGLPALQPLGPELPRSAKLLTRKVQSFLSKALVTEDILTSAAFCALTVTGQPNQGHIYLCFSSLPFSRRGIVPCGDMPWNRSRARAAQQHLFCLAGQPCQIPLPHFQSFLRRAMMLYNPVLQTVSLEQRLIRSQELFRLNGSDKPFQPRAALGVICSNCSVTKT